MCMQMSEYVICIHTRVYIRLAINDKAEIFRNRNNSVSKDAH